MEIVLEDYTTEEQRSVVRFCGQKDSMQRICIKKCFLFTVGSVCHITRFHPGGKRFGGDEQVQMELREWLREQSKDLYTAGFDTLVKQLDKCINVSGEYVEK
jgi:hypothetical protein